MIEFKISNNLTKDSLPVIESPSVQQVFTCSEFKGQLSSITGIISRFLYINKINQLTCESEVPTVRIICGIECINKCINLYKNYDKSGSISSQ